MEDAAALIAKRDRSPAFPYVGLERAVELTRELYKRARRFEVPLSGAAKDWGLAPTSSSTLRTAAALQAYGLAEQNGSGESRKIKVSDLAWRILEDPDPQRRKALLAEAALKPALIAEYASVWNEGRPDDDHAIFQLKSQSGFTDDGAPKFLRVFDETKRFFPESVPDRVRDTEGASAALPARESASPSGCAKVGDFVQWESGGVLQFAEPRRVVAVHESGDWVFVEGSQTGIAMQEVTVQKVASSAEARREAPPVLAVASGGVTEFKAGEAEWLRGPLSKETSYRLIVSGDMGPREIGKLIKVLKAQQAVLLDEDEAEDAD